MTPARARHLWVCFRLLPDEYETILKHQGGVCAGCGRPPNGISLAVDHCHRTGRIRGLLCWHCNRAIGILRDKATTANNLGAYLEAPPAPAALGKETFGLIGQAKANKKKKVYGPPNAVEENHGVISVAVRVGGVRRRRTVRPSA